MPLFCSTCHNRSNCVKTCPRIEEYLTKQGIYSSDYIRPMVSAGKRKDKFGKYREIPFSALGNKLSYQIGIKEPKNGEN